MRFRIIALSTVSVLMVISILLSGPFENVEHAYLQFPNGVVINLDSMPIGPILSRNGWKVVKEAENFLVYTHGRNAPMDSFFRKEHQLMVPMGETWSLLLANTGSYMDIFEGAQFSFNPSITGPTGEAMANLLGSGYFHVPWAVNLQVDGCTLTSNNDANFLIKAGPWEQLSIYCFAGDLNLYKDFAKYIPSAHFLTVATSKLTEGENELHYSVKHHRTFIFSDKSLPTILNQFVRRYGLRGYKYAAEMDTSANRYIEGWAGKESMEDWEDFFSTSPFDWKVRNDSIIVNLRREDSTHNFEVIERGLYEDRVAFYF